MNEASLIEIHPSALRHNIAILGEIVGPGCVLCPVVKSNAYGLGLERVVPELDRGGAAMLAVFDVAEAARVIATGVAAPVLVLGAVHEAPSLERLYRPLMSGRLQFAVHDLAHAHALDRLSRRLGIRISVHLEVDTGMSRGGCSPDEAERVLGILADRPRLELRGVMTHFADADRDEAFTRDQLDRFDRFLRDAHRLIPAGAVVHAASTFTVLRHRRYHRSMVRVGLAWAGYGLDLLEGAERIEGGRRLRPCFTWRSRIGQIKRVAPGATVGYGRTWTARRETVLGLVPVGYTHGYPRRIGANGERQGSVVGVAVGDEMRYAPVVGTVSMEQMSIDLTDVVADDDAGAIAVGTEVELIGTDVRSPTSLVEVAHRAGTIPHELMSRLHPAIPRVRMESAHVQAESVRSAESAEPATWRLNSRVVEVRA